MTPCDSLGGDSPDQIQYSAARYTDSVMKEDTQMADHKHGEMDIQVQEKTFDGFVKATTYSVIGIICLLVFIAIVNG